VSDEAFETHPAGFVTMRIPVVEFDGIDIDQIRLPEGLDVLAEGLDRAVVSDGVPIAPLDTLVIMKLLAGRTQDHADVEAMVASGTDRDRLRAAVQRAVPHLVDALEKLFGNVDRAR
jgi:hypothetical protein